MNLSLAEAIFWIAALACVVAQIALLRSSLSTKGEQRSELVPVSRRSSEIGWAILPALVLTVLLFATWRTIAERDEHQHMDHGGISAAATNEPPHSTPTGS